MKYYILFRYPGQKKLYVMSRSDDSIVYAEEGNQQLLIEMAEQLKKENLIAEFILVKEVDVV